MLFQYKSQTIAYSDTLTGKPLLLLHGFLNDSQLWEYYIDKIPPYYRIISIDLPGHGNSSPLSKPMALTEIAQILIALTKHLKLNNISIIGHSLGAYIALAYLKIQPKEVKKIMLLNASTTKDSVYRKTQRDRAIKAINHHFERFASICIANLYTPTTKELEIQMQKLKNIAKKTDPISAIYLLKAMKNRPDNTNTLHAFKGNKKMILSKKDLITPYVENLTLHQGKIPVISLEKGHLSPIEQPLMVLQEINLFLKN